MGIGPWELAIILFILAGPLLLGVLFVAFLLIRGRSAKENSSDSATPLQILQERYARGEIDTEEYEERRRRILNDQS
jgi:putative membrane protein